MSEIKPCPCGVVPEKLFVSQGDTYRWARASAGCCGVWEIEFRRPSRALELDGPEVQAAAIIEWNAAPRGTPNA